MTRPAVNHRSTTQTSSFPSLPYVPFFSSSLAESIGPVRHTPPPSTEYRSPPQKNLSQSVTRVIVAQIPIVSARHIRPSLPRPPVAANVKTAPPKVSCLQ